MQVLRSLIHDDVIMNKIIELQVKFFEAIVDSDVCSTEFLIDNNQKTYDNPETTDEKKANLIINVAQLNENQQNRIDNSTYYKNKIKFMQDIFDLAPNDFIEVNDTVKEFIK